MIVETQIRLLVREHLLLPINGKILTIGRQTVPYTLEQVLAIMEDEGYAPAEQLLKNIVVTVDHSTRVGSGNNYIDDKCFFALFGVDSIESLDVSSYEGADIIHDLNRPIPPALEEIYDYVIDGGTFDHTFDIRTCFENISKLLKAHGRIMMWNAASNFTGAAYLSFGPDIFCDYFAINRFDKCQVYLCEGIEAGQLRDWEFYYFNPARYSLFLSEKMSMVVVFAQKGADSTFHKIPIQGQYRDTELQKYYKAFGEVNKLKGKIDDFIPKKVRGFEYIGKI